MGDQTLFVSASVLLNIVSLMNFRIPDERVNMLLLIVPTFIAVVVGVPMWMYVVAEVSVVGGIGAAIAPILLVPRIERLLEPRRRIWLSWALLVVGVVCARSALHSPFWL
ncbi:MAG: hypothetical protein ACREF3_08325 [Acetobacteraceae bacterium]